MGSRGQKAPKGMRPAETVDYDNWGTFLDGANQKLIKDKDGTVIGYIYDRYGQDTEEDIRPITKKAILDDVEAWKNDDGTYGGGDETIYVFYEDGKMVNLTELEAGQKWKKSGIIGVSVSTGDYESVWGSSIHKGHRVPLQTWSEDGESGVSNSYSGYKVTKTWKERIEETYVPKENGKGYRTQRRKIRVSNKVDSRW